MWILFRSYPYTLMCDINLVIGIGEFVVYAVRIDYRRNLVF